MRHTLVNYSWSNSYKLYLRIKFCHIVETDAITLALPTLEYLYYKIQSVCVIVCLYDRVE